MSAAHHCEQGGSQHERAIEHRDAALKAIVGLKPTSAEESLGLALLHAILAVEARIEELTEELPR